MDKQSLSFLQSNTNTYFSDILNLMQIWNPKSLQSFHSVRFHIHGFFPACISKSSKAWYYFLGMWVHENRMMWKIPPLFCRLTSWAQWPLFPVCCVLGPSCLALMGGAQPSLMAAVSGPEQESTQSTGRGRATMDLGSGEVAYTSLRLFGSFFFHSDKATS